MLMTEQEAREKWCPMGRTLATAAIEGVCVSATAINGGKDGDGEKMTVCVGSRCAMWRWEVIYSSEPNTPSIKRGERGYCGLAGRPEIA